MKIVIAPRRRATPLAPDAFLPNPEERAAGAAMGRHEMAQKLLRRFPQAKIVRLVGDGDLLIDLPDSEPHLPSAIRASLDVVTGPDPGAPPSGPVWNHRQPTLEEIERTHRDALYRPTVVAVVRDEQDRLLLVQSDKNGEWGLVQGRIEPDEAPIVALGRELGEEIDVGGESYVPKAYLGCADIDAPAGSVSHLPFTVGVRYFIFEVAYLGLGELRLQKEELSAYQWVSARPDDPALLSLLRQTRKTKQELIAGILIRLM